MPRYKLIHCFVEARQTGLDYDQDCNIIRWCNGRAVGEDDFVGNAIIELYNQDRELVYKGDWVIRDEDGEFSALNPSLFEKYYE